MDSIVAGLAPDQLGDALLLRTESLLLADVCAAAPPLRLDDSTDPGDLGDLGDLGDQLLGGITDRNQQDATAPLEQRTVTPNLTRILIRILIRTLA